MADPDDDLLLCLQSSLRNALATFGPDSVQYRNIKSLVDEQAVKIALRDMNLGPTTTNDSTRGPRDVVMDG
ncbi:hypothetical protein DM02DRAFT_613260 [Periconia macrospinosa]|uniref:Uncharacterized protein n=1 Tax=Periconia macrospinosa TaxID=97972 RepID=A0A2V1DUR2_9PLEO|nr:hypothetical protein DM02DRAFT_613260 [Periconia macrospinosa]